MASNTHNSTLRKASATTNGNVPYPPLPIQAQPTHHSSTETISPPSPPSPNPTPSSLESQLHALKQHLAILQTENAALKTESAHLKSQNAALDSALTALQTQQSSLNSENTNLKSQTTSLTTTATALQTENADLAEQVKTMEMFFYNPHVTMGVVELVDTPRGKDIRVLIINNVDIKTPSGQSMLVKKGTLCRDVYDGDWVEFWCQKYMEAMTNGKGGVTFEADHMEPSGRLVTIQTEIQYLGLVNGFPRFSNIIQDRSDHFAVVRALQESEERLRLALSNTNDGLWDARFGNGPNFASCRLLEMYGFKENESEEIFKWFTQPDYFHPEDREMAIAAHTAHLAGKTDRYEIKFRAKVRSGQYKWFHARGKVIQRDASGKPVRFIGTSIDCTEQRQLEEDIQNADRRMREILNLAPVGIIQWSLDDKMVFANKAAIRMCGRLDANESADAKILEKWGYQLGELIHPEDVERVKKGLRDSRESLTPFTSMFRLKSKRKGNCGAGTEDHGEEERWDRDDDLMWVRLVTNPLTDRNGNCDAVLAALTDMTELKKTEAALKSALAKAEIASQSKDNFLANMSHEVRTPLNGIIGLIGLLQDTDLDNLQSEWVDNIRTSADCLLQIVNDILDFSKIEAGKLELHHELFNLREVVASVINLFHIKATEKSIHFSVEVLDGVPKWIISDPGRLRQVLVNLVGNAVKFMSSGSLEVKISNSCDNIPGHPPISQSQQRLQFVVKDTGIGIAADKLEKLFKPFEQGDASTSRSYGGTGLGLCISKRLVEMLGGSIGVRSEESVGSEFWFNIVVEKPAPPKSSSIDSALGSERESVSSNIQSGLSKRRDHGSGGLMDDARRTRSGGIPGGSLEVVGKEVREGSDELEILVAEDNMINQKLLAQLLRRLSCNATFANNGLETLHSFIERLRDPDKRDFNVILMDMQMPKMDGLEATREIRKFLKGRGGDVNENEKAGKGGTGKGPIIVAVTANAMEKDRKNCLDAGMDMFLTKPIKLDAFVDVMKGCLRMIRERQ